MGKICLVGTQKYKPQKEKMNEYDIKLNVFTSLEDPVKKIKREVIEREKVLTRHTLTKG